MPKLKSFFNSKGDALILEIKISTHELAHANLDVEAFEKIMEYDKDPSLVSQLRAILGMIEFLESLNQEDEDYNIYQYINRNTRFTSSTIQSPFYGTNLNANQVKQQAMYNSMNLANAAPQPQHVAQAQPIKSPPQQPSPLRIFNHCPKCKKQNTWNIFNCTKCGAILNYP